MQLIRGLRSGWIFAHPKPHLAFNIPVYPDVYPSSINVPKHFTVMLYSKFKKLRIVKFIFEYQLFYFMYIYKIYKKN